MRPFNRKLLRDLRRHLAEVLGVVIIVAIGITLFTGLLFSRTEQREYIDNIYRETAYEDFEVDVDAAPPDAVDDLRSIDGVEAAEGRQVRKTVARVKSRDITVDIVSVPSGRKASVDSPLLQQGEYSSLAETGAALAEYHLADTYGLGTGDSIEVETPGGRRILTIVGSALSPEYLRPSGGDMVIVGDQKLFGVLFVSEEEATRLFETTDVNSFVATTVPGADVDALLEQAQKALEPFRVVRATLGGDAPGTMLVNFDLDNEGTIALFFGTLMLGVAALAVYVALTRMISSQQREVGAARALGYTSRSVAFHYLAYGMSVGLVGALLGTVTGYLMSIAFVRVYVGTMGLPSPGVIGFHPEIIAAGFAVALLFSAIGAALPAARSARMRPAEAMRLEAGLALKVKAPGRGPGLTSRLPSWLRLTVRNLLRNRRRTVLTCIATTFALAGLIAGGAMVFSVDRGVHDYLELINTWDVAVRFSTLQGGATLDEVAAVPGVEYAEPMLEFPARLLAGERSEDVDVRALLPDTRLHASRPSRGSPARPGGAQILLNSAIAHDLGVKRGDRVRLQTSAGTLPVEVAGTVEEPLGGISYMDLPYARSLVGDDALNVVIATTAPGAGASVARDAAGLDGVAQVTTRQQNRDLMDKLLGAIKPFMNMIYLLVLVISFGVMLTMSTVNALERTQEFATMRTLGVGVWRVTGLLSVEALAVALICLVPGAALGLVMQWILITKLMSSKLVSLPYIYPGGILAVWLPVFVASSLLAGAIPARGLAKLDLARVTKERTG
ncbi:MAG: FtsX-like permease family protein [Actinobacteria bacterium]|nr:FtsX-like permease family protein [Actinomycetota bacterium]MBU1944194.1 FtsX-like permease family protein [Actinomycetota bacterium]MBU2688683.1 FtsX-like permease family protein [Actinomycetota bacterium]